METPRFFAEIETFEGNLTADFRSATLILNKTEMQLSVALPNVLDYMPPITPLSPKSVGQFMGNVHDLVAIGQTKQQDEPIKKSFNRGYFIKQNQTMRQNGYAFPLVYNMTVNADVLCDGDPAHPANTLPKAVTTIESAYTEMPQTRKYRYGKFLDMTFAADPLGQQLEKKNRDGAVRMLMAMEYSPILNKLYERKASQVGNQTPENLYNFCAPMLLQSGLVTYGEKNKLPLVTLTRPFVDNEERIALLGTTDTRDYGERQTEQDRHRYAIVPAVNASPITYLNAAILAHAQTHKGQNLFTTQQVSAILIELQKDNFLGRHDKIHRNLLQKPTQD